MIRAPGVVFFSHDHIGQQQGRKKGFRALFTRNKREIRESFHLDEVLLRLIAALKEARFTDLSRITVAGDQYQDYYYDSGNRPNDLEQGVRDFRAGFLEPEERHLIQIMLQLNQPPLNFLLTVTIQRQHSLQVGFLYLAFFISGNDGRQERQDLEKKIIQDLILAVVKHLPVADYQQNFTGKRESINSPAEDLAALALSSESETKKKTENPISGKSIITYGNTEVVARELQLFPLFGVTLGATTVAQLQTMGSHTKSTGDDGKPYKYYVINGLNVWYDNHLADHLYLTYSDPVPGLWRDLGFDWQLSFVEVEQFLKRICQEVGYVKTPQVIDHYSGTGKCFNAEIQAFQRAASYSINIRAHFNYAKGKTKTTEKGTLYSLSVGVT